MTAAHPRLPLLYVLHSGNLYGTERIALATASGLETDYHATIFAPPGPVLDEARRRGLEARAFRSARDLAVQMWPWFRANRRLAFIATGVSHSLIASALAQLTRCRLGHLQVVGGGADEGLSYSRKRRLNRIGLQFVAVSGYVRERLMHHGVRAERIVVIENFLAPEQIAAAPHRLRFDRPGVRRVVVVSRTDPIKKIDVLLDALDLDASLRGRLEVRVLGSGWDLAALRARAAAHNPNVLFAGFVANIPFRNRRVRSAGSSVSSRAVRSRDP